MNSRPPWRWRVSLLVVLAAVGALAQDRPPWFTRAWQSDVGLPDNTVVGIEQAPDGFLWVATPVGLVRFDGVQFRPFAPETAAGGPAGLIQALLVDRRGRIWVAKERGTVICVDQGRTTAVYTPEKGSPNPEVQTTTPLMPLAAQSATMEGTVSRGETTIARSTSYGISCAVG